MKKQLATGLILATTTLSQAAVIVNDDFTDGERSTETSSGGTLTSLKWYLSAPSSNYGTLGVVNDLTFGNALQLSKTPTKNNNNTRAIGLFTPQTLSATGDKIQLSLDFRMSTPYADNGGLRIGLANSNGTQQTADTENNNTPPVANDKSYWLQQNVGSNTAGSELRQEDGTAVSILGGTDSVLVPTSGTAIAINDTLKRSLIFTVTKTATGVSLEAILKDADGLTLTTLTGTPSAAITTFDEVAFGNFSNETSAAITVDNVKVETIVPEPTALGLMGLGTLFLRRRRH